jgi:hypothetical protein
MKIHLANYEPGRIGGGWNFMRNFVTGMSEYISDYESADIYFIASPSMVQRDQVQQAKSDGKKIILRIDNAVRNSRNRNTGMSRMFDFAQWADLVVYQSQWARDYLQPFTKKEGIVILNGVDQTLYYAPTNKPDGDSILYSRFNRDETKNFEVARYWFSRYYVEHPDSRLYIVGQFSQELQDGNFDFYNNERFQFFGTLPPENMADLYRNCHKFLYTYYNDACSNTLIEALVSGCEIVGDNYYQTTGGAMEILRNFSAYGEQYFTLKRMCDEYKAAMESL